MFRDVRRLVAFELPLRDRLQSAIEKSVHLEYKFHSTRGSIHERVFVDIEEWRFAR